MSKLSASAFGLSELLVFLAAYALAVFSPGPAVAAVVARSLGTGFRRTLPFIAGIVIGDLVWFNFAVLGLSVLAQTLFWLFTTIKYLCVAYLLYLAWKLWTAPAAAIAPAQNPGGGWRLMIGGLSLTLGNPKVMIFFIAILPSVLDLHTMTLFAYVAIASIIALTLGGAMAAYALAAHRARRLISSPRAIQRVNRGSGIVMAGAAVAIGLKG